MVKGDCPVLAKKGEESNSNVGGALDNSRIPETIVVPGLPSVPKLLAVSPWFPVCCGSWESARIARGFLDTSLCIKRIGKNDPEDCT